MVPTKDKIKAVFQWSGLLAVGLPVMFLGLVLVPLNILTSKRRMNDFGEHDQEHSAKYKGRGSSGRWEYRSSTVPILRLYSNYEDGSLGEPSGKWSATCGGDERSFWSQYKWLALRNPINMLKRTNPFFHCRVDDCSITWWGDRDVDDKGFNWGWHLVRATHRETGKQYYGYRKTASLGDGKCRQHRYGFKIKPSHASEVQDADDKDKAFTFRYQHRSDIN